MAFFDNIGKKISLAGEGALNKGKALADVARLNSNVSEEEKKINNSYYQIGKLYIALHPQDYESDFAALVNSIVSSQDRIVSSFVGYRGAVRKFMNAYKAEDADAMVDMTCSFMQDEDYAELVAYDYENRLENDFDSFDYYFDSKYSIKYEIKNKSKLSNRQSKSVMEQLASNGLASEDDIDSVKKIMNIKIVITAKQGSDSTSISKTVYFAKESGGWKLLDFE